MQQYSKFAWPSLNRERYAFSDTVPVASCSLFPGINLIVWLLKAKFMWSKQVSGFFAIVRHLISGSTSNGIKLIPNRSKNSLTVLTLNVASMQNGNQGAVLGKFGQRAKTLPFTVLRTALVCAVPRAHRAAEGGESMQRT